MRQLDRHLGEDGKWRTHHHPPRLRAPRPPGGRTGALWREPRRLPRRHLEVRQGTLRDAKWFSFGVNAEHGYARSKEDVARILRAIFEDTEWRTTPIAEIARHTRIPESTVRWHYNKTASSQVAKIAKPTARTVTRGGKSYTMDTAGT